MNNTDVIGLRFCFDGYEKHFDIIFSKIDVKKYVWHVTNSEIHCLSNPYQKAFLLPPNIYSGEEFSDEIKCCDYHAIHARMFAAPAHDPSLPKNIDDYEAFLKSPFEIALLCADCYADFYAKDPKVIRAVADACIHNQKSDQSFLTKENDTRTGFYI